MCIKHDLAHGDRNAPLTVGQRVRKQMLYFQIMLTVYE